MPDPCPFCGLRPTPRADAAAAISNHGRLLSAEAWMRLSSPDERLAAVRFLGDVLDRPVMRLAAYRSIAQLLATVRDDIAYHVADPLSPSVDGLLIPMPHPLVDVPLDDAGGGDPDALRSSLGGPFAP